MSKRIFLIKRLKNRFGFFFADNAYYEAKVAKFSANLNYQLMVQDINNDIRTIWNMGNYDNVITYINESFYDALTPKLNLEQLAFLIKNIRSVGLRFNRDILEELLDACPILEDIFSSLVGYEPLENQDIEKISDNPHVQKALKFYCYIKNRYNGSDKDSLIPQKNRILLPNGKLLSAREQIELVEAYRNGDEAALEKLIFAYTMYITKLAKSYANKNVSFDDLFQEGVIGAINAIQNFDLAKPDKISNFICVSIKGAMKAYFLQSKYPYDWCRVYTYDLTKKYLEDYEGHCTDEDLMRYLEIDRSKLNFWKMVTTEAISYDAIMEENSELLASGYSEESDIYDSPVYNMLCIWFSKLPENRQKVIELRLGYTPYGPFTYEKIRKILFNNVSKQMVEGLNKKAMTLLSYLFYINGYKVENREVINSNQKYVDLFTQENIPVADIANTYRFLGEDTSKYLERIVDEKILLGYQLGILSPRLAFSFSLFSPEEMPTYLTEYLTKNISLGKLKELIKMRYYVPKAKCRVRNKSTKSLGDE